MLTPVGDDASTALHVRVRPDPDKSAQLPNRLDVVLHPEIANAVDSFGVLPSGARAFDYERRRLLAAPVAASTPSCLEHRDQPLGQRSPVSS